MTTASQLTCPKCGSRMFWWCPIEEGSKGEARCPSADWAYQDWNKGTPCDTPRIPLVRLASGDVVVAQGETP